MARHKSPPIDLWRERRAKEDPETRRIFAIMDQYMWQIDRCTIDPWINELPLPEQQRIMALPGAGVGIEGRALVVREAIAALKRYWAVPA